HRYERLLLLHDTATLWFFTLSLHDALPIYLCPCFEEVCFKDKSLSAHVCIADLANVLFTYTSDTNAANCRLAASGLHRVGFADRPLRAPGPLYGQYANLAKPLLWNMDMYAIAPERVRQVGNVGNRCVVTRLLNPTRLGLRPVQDQFVCVLEDHRAVSLLI